MIQFIKDALALVALNLENNGRILFDHYTSQSQVEALIALGNLSSLGEEVGIEHPFDPPRYGSPEHDAHEKKFGRMCLAYGRDRHETDTAAHVAVTLAECWPEEETWTEFTYVWDDGKWRVGDPDEGTQTLIDLGDALTGKKTLKPAVKAFGMIIGQHAAHDPAKPADHKWGGAK